MGQASPSFFGGGPINEEQKSALSICRRHRQGVAHLWVNVNVLCKSVISCVFCFTNLHTATSYQSLRRRQYFVSSGRLLGHDLDLVAGRVVPRSYRLVLRRWVSVACRHFTQSPRSKVFGGHCLCKLLIPFRSMQRCTFQQYTALSSSGAAHFLSNEA